MEMAAWGYAVISTFFHKTIWNVNNFYHSVRMKKRQHSGTMYYQAAVGNKTIGKALLFRH